MYEILTGGRHPIFNEKQDTLESYKHKLLNIKDHF